MNYFVQLYSVTFSNIAENILCLTVGDYL